MHIGHVGEVFVDQFSPASRERRSVGCGHEKAADQSRIDKLACSKPLGIGVAARGDSSVYNRNDVCCGRTHIHE
jgi:hypothetical protein